MCRKVFGRNFLASYPDVGGSSIEENLEVLRGSSDSDGTVVLSLSDVKWSRKWVSKKSGTKEIVMFRGFWTYARVDAEGNSVDTSASKLYLLGADSDGTVGLANGETRQKKSSKGQFDKLQLGRRVCGVMHTGGVRRKQQQCRPSRQEPLRGQQSSDASSWDGQNSNDLRAWDWLTKGRASPFLSTLSGTFSYLDSRSPSFLYVLHHFLCLARYFLSTVAASNSFHPTRRYSSLAAPVNFESVYYRPLIISRHW